MMLHCAKCLPVECGMNITKLLFLLRKAPTFWIQKMFFIRVSYETKASFKNVESDRILACFHEKMLRAHQIHCKRSFVTVIAAKNDRLSGRAALVTKSRKNSLDEIGHSTTFCTPFGMMKKLSRAPRSWNDGVVQHLGFFCLSACFNHEFA